MSDLLVFHVFEKPLGAHGKSRNPVLKKNAVIALVPGRSFHDVRMVADHFVQSFQH